MSISETWKRQLVLRQHRRLLGISSAMVLFLICVACGDVYRPVAQPLTGPSPNPAAVHFVYAISANGDDTLSSSGSCSPSGVTPPCVADPGSFSRIDVSGDSVSSAVRTGVFPLHAALTPSGNNYYVVSSDGTVSSGVAVSGATPTIINLPQLCANGCLPSPSFVHSTEAGKMYVADIANGAVSTINTSANVIVQTVAVDPAFSGSPLPSSDPNSRPVALAELPNGSKLYVANQGTNRVTSINTLDGSIAAVIPVSGSPVWAVAGGDNIHVYVLTSNGTISVISSLSDTVISASASAGAGANFMLYDKGANFLYVTNPAAATVSIFDVSSDPPVLRGGAPIGIATIAGSGCSSAIHPTSVTVLGDGTRAYVASYQADPGTICAQASVIDSGTNAVTKTIALPQASNLAQTACSSARFRVFTASSGGAKTSPFKVYVSQCDAGSVSVIDTFATNAGPDPHPADVVMSTVPSPVSSFPAVAGGIPPFQNPVFLVAGP